MKPVLIAAALLLALPLTAQSGPNCPDGYKGCGNVCCPK